MTIDDVINALKGSVLTQDQEVLMETLKLAVYRGDIDAYIHEVIATAQGLLDVKLQMLRLDSDACRAAARQQADEASARILEALKNMKTKGVH